MSSTKGFFQLILLSMGVFVVFTLIAYMPTLGISGPCVGENSVLSILAPLILVFCFLGMIAYAVTHKQ